MESFKENFYKGNYFYHGTLYSRIPKIIQQGILPKGSGGLSATKSAKQEAKQGVYLSRNSKQAIKYATTVARHYNKSDNDAVIIKIKIPQDVVTQLTPDLRSYQKGDYFYKGAIPPEWIVAAYDTYGRGIHI